VNEIICFTVKQEELTKEVTAAFERGIYFYWVFSCHAYQL